MFSEIPEKNIWTAHLPIGATRRSLDTLDPAKASWAMSRCMLAPSPGCVGIEKKVSPCDGIIDQNACNVDRQEDVTPVLQNHEAIARCQPILLYCICACLFIFHYPSNRAALQYCCRVRSLIQKNLPKSMWRTRLAHIFFFLQTTRSDAPNLDRVPSARHMA